MTVPKNLNPNEENPVTKPPTATGTSVDKPEEKTSAGVQEQPKKKPLNTIRERWVEETNEKLNKKIS